MIKRFGFMSRCCFLSGIFVLLIWGLASAGQNIFSHKLLTLTLPEGWSVNEAAATDNELIGVIKSDSVPGASILIFSYRGVTLNYRNIRIRGLKRIAADYPKGQNHLKKPQTVKTEKGYKPKYELWQGFLDSGGTTVALQSPMAAFKGKNSYILMIGYVADVYGAKMEEDFLKILKSAD